MLTEYSGIIDFAIGVCTLGAILWGYAKFAHKRVSAWWAPWSEAFKAVAQLPVALTAFSGAQGQIDRIAKQVATDDGSSIAEALKTLRAGQFESHGMQNNLSARLEAVAAQVTRLSANQRVRQDSDPKCAVFECHADGRTELVNKTYLRWTGLRESEVVGLGWLNAVHIDDQPRVRAEWHLAVEESRTCSMRFRMVSSDGDSFLVESTATPIPEGQAPPDRWIGIIFRIDA